MDILLAPVLGCAGAGFVLFLIQLVLALLPCRWPARLFPFGVLALWIGFIAWGIHNNPGGYILILSPGFPLALFGMLGLYLGYHCSRFFAPGKK